MILQFNDILYLHILETNSTHDKHLITMIQCNNNYIKLHSNKGFNKLHSDAHRQINKISMLMNSLKPFLLKIIIQVLFMFCSLLKVHLQLRGFSVFLDIEKLRAGKFDDNLLLSIRNAKHFILVLTQNALDRCQDDNDKKDWVHRVSSTETYRLMSLTIL